MKKAFCKILLFTIPNVSLARKYPYMEISLGPSILSTALEREGYKVDYYDLNIALNSIWDAEEKFSVEENKILSNLSLVINFIESPMTDSLIYKKAVALLKIVEGSNYDYICLSLERKSKKPFVFNMAICFAIILSSLLKKKYGCPIFLGGSVACYAYGIKKLGKIVKEFKNIPIDAFFVRAKAREFVEFISAFNNNSSIILTDKSLEAIFSDKFNQLLKNKSIKLKKVNKARFTNIKYIYYPPNYSLQNKNELFFDLKSILPKHILVKYPELGEEKPFYIAPFLFSWGCPFRCGFCMTGSYGFSFLSPNKAVDELERIVEKYSVTNFRFYNSQINFSEKYVFSFCNEIKKRNLKIKFSDSGNLFFASKEIFKALKEAGCIKLWFGAETLSPRLQKIYKTRLNNEKIISGLTNSARAGIWNAVDFIINFPYESEKEFKMLIDFIGSNSYVIDCWECHNFMLHQDAKIFHNPEYFGVAISKTDDLIWGYNYDEIKGLKWDEKLVRGKSRLNEFRKEFDYYRNLVFKNDYLLFGFSSTIDEKERIKDIFNSLVSYFQNNSSTKRLVDKNGNLESMDIETYARYIYPESVPSRTYDSKE